MDRKRSLGEVFTRVDAVEFILNEVGYTSERDLSNFSLLEPASGHGAFAIAILERLWASSKRYHFSFPEAVKNNLWLVELDPENHRNLALNISAWLSSNGIAADEVVESILHQGDFLTMAIGRRFDGVVGNPPYVRHELIPEALKTMLRKQFRTFTHRADLYIPFFEKGLHLLQPNGRLSFICSNRWLTNQYGKGLRELIAKAHHLETLLNIEKTSPFENAVIAYPGVVTIAKRNTADSYTKVCLSDQEEVDFDKLHYSVAKPPDSADWARLFVQFDLQQDGLCLIGELGFEIGIGVATGADAVFIGDKAKFEGVEESRLMPLVMTSDLRHGRLDWAGRYVANPFDEQGLVDLSNYPGLSSYFLSHRQALSNRHVAAKQPKHWYKTIDKIKSDLQSKPKLLLPDISSPKWLIVDDGGFYPHHNLYFIIGRPKEDLQLLACILMSQFATRQVMDIGVSMNGGIPRYQAQTLRKLRIPNLDRFSDADRNGLLEAYGSRDAGTINAIVEKVLNGIGLGIEHRNKAVLALPAASPLTPPTPC